MLPILLPGEEILVLSSQLEASSVRIHMDGHRDAQIDEERWYSLGDLNFLAR